MLKAKSKLELTWIGKEYRARIEPRILLEDSELSHHASHRVTEQDQFDNRLIFGDNLLALKALEQEFAGRIKCIYIDPPFNTGSAFEHYDDGMEHSTWLSLMRERLVLLRQLLSVDGILVIHLDGSEMAYAKVLLDEVFGRFNHLNTVTMTTNEPSGFKATSAKIFSTANYLLLYAKDKSQGSLQKVFIERGYDAAYSKVLRNPDAPIDQWRWDNVGDVVARKAGFENVRRARIELQQRFDELVAEYAINNASKVFRTAAIGGGAKAKRLATIEKSRQERDRVHIHPGEDIEGFYILNGEQILFYENRLVEVDGTRVPGQVITDVWTDISWTGIAREGGVEFKNGKKPEALIKRIVEMCTEPTDWILDSFAGSGTTGAVAHKMGRRWIMVELGEHCHTHVLPRIRGVVDGTDQTGISNKVNWRGGGGFRYFSLAPSLLERDKWGHWVISKEYDAAMLAEAMCKHEGFVYAPSDSVYWQQGFSTETDFIYTTTQNLNQQQLHDLSDEVGEDRTLLVCCTAFRANPDNFSNLTIKKIPKAVLNRCEFGRDDYSLKVSSLPSVPASNLFELQGDEQ